MFSIVRNKLQQQYTQENILKAIYVTVDVYNQGICIRIII